MVCMSKGERLRELEKGTSRGLASGKMTEDLVRELDELVAGARVLCGEMAINRLIRPLSLPRTIVTNGYKKSNLCFENMNAYRPYTLGRTPRTILPKAFMLRISRESKGQKDKCPKTELNRRPRHY